MAKTTDPLDEERFTYTASQSGLVQIAFRGRVVTRLGSREADRFLAKIAPLDAKGQQLLMAKITGHFKHGNKSAGRG